MNVDKAVRLFKLCVHAELDFKQMQRPSLVRRAIRKQHQLYCFVVKDVSKDYQDSPFKVGKIERLAYEIIKLDLTGRLEVSIDDDRKTVHLSQKRKKVAVNDSNR